MADVVVDAKPKPQLPYDPDVIPPAVRRRAAAVDALYSSTAIPANAGQPTNGSGAESRQTAPEAPEPSVQPEAPATPQEPAQPGLSSPTPAPPAPADSSPPSPDEQNWKRQALAWEGRYKAQTKQVDEMQEQMTQLGNELLQTQRLLDRRQVRTPQPDQTPPPVYVTEQDVQNYGTDLVDFSQRAAIQAVAPHLQTLERQNAELRQQLAREARRSLDQMVEAAVPNYREIDRNPRWHNWLLGVDLYTGRVRQTLLDEAIAAASAPRVISFFRGFLNEEVATGHMESAGSPQAAPPREPAIQLSSLAAPGRARPAGGGDSSLPPDKPIYTRANIRDLYTAHRKGAYIGREAEWNRIETDLFAAQREGRVQG